MGENLGTSRASGDVTCNSCGYVGDVHTYLPVLSVYHDIACPKCRSTRNEHNRIYLENLQRSMRELSRKDEPDAQTHPGRDRGTND
jgi:hypothetical protein